MEIHLDDDLIDYLVYASGTLDKVENSKGLMLEIDKILDVVKDQEDQEVENVYANQEEDLMNQQPDESEDYADEFDDSKVNKRQNDQDQDPVVQDEDPLETEPQKPTGEGEDLDEEIDDEQMISIAENCLIRIAEELLNKKLTIRQLFKGEIIEEEIEGEKIELLFPTTFLDGIQKLGITEFSDLENACLMNVLAKPQLENTILLDELIDIMENLGIPDGENMSPEQDDDIDDGSPPQKQQETPEPTQENKPKKKGVDVNSLSDDAKMLLLNLIVYLEQESMTVANLYEDVKYQQMVKTKKKQTSVDIVPAEDFFRIIEDNYEIVSDVNLTDDVKRELQAIL